MNKNRIKTIAFAFIWMGLGRDIQAQSTKVPTLEIPEHPEVQYLSPPIYNHYQGGVPVQTPQPPPRLSSVSNQSYSYDILYLPHSSKGIPLPSYKRIPETKYFEQAFSEIDSMLAGYKDLDLKKAVFVSENAWYGGKLDYKQFNAKIKQIKNMCLTKLRQKGLGTNNDMAKKMVIYHYITDTLKIKKTGSEQQTIHYPVKYDFDNLFTGNKMKGSLVSDVLFRNEGQCYSIPLFYLIMAKELGTEAHWSLSPKHTFIKFKNENGRWLCMELTSHAIVDDNYYMSSGYIKPESLKNKIYLEPLSDTQTVALLLARLGLYYQNKYGYDAFVRKSAETALKYDSNCLTATMNLSNYYTYAATFTLRRLGYPAEEKVKRLYPEVDNCVKISLKLYDKIDNIGYEEIPNEIYAQWLKNAEKEMQKPEYRQNIKFQQITK